MGYFVKALSEEDTAKLLVDYEDGFTNVQLAERYGVSIRTVYRILARARVRRSRNAKFARKAPPPKRKLKPCGTPAAYRRHKRKKEMPCSDCLTANATAVREAKAAKKAAEADKDKCTRGTMLWEKEWK